MTHPNEYIADAMNAVFRASAEIEDNDRYQWARGQLLDCHAKLRLVAHTLRHYEAFPAGMLTPGTSVQCPEDAAPNAPLIGPAPKPEKE